MSDQSPFSPSEKNPPPQASFAPPQQFQPQPTNTPGLVGFILSLTGLIAPCMFPIGMVVSLFGLGKQPKGLAIAGLIIGAIGTVILVAVLAIYGAMLFACIGLASAVQPAMETQMALQEAELKIDDYYYENDELPDVTTGNALISGITDGWDNELQYELDEDAFEGYRIRSAGPDGIFDNDDDSTSDEYYGDASDEDWEEYEFDESEWDDSGMDGFDMEESGMDDSGVEGFDTEESGMDIELEVGDTEAAEVDESAEEVIIE